jgi:hypothetical protein
VRFACRSLNARRQKPGFGADASVYGGGGGSAVAGGGEEGLVDGNRGAGDVFLGGEYVMAGSNMGGGGVMAAKDGLEVSIISGIVRLSLVVTGADSNELCRRKG